MACDCLNWKLRGNWAIQRKVYEEWRGKVG